MQIVGALLLVVLVASGRGVTAHGVRLTVPADWERVHAAPDAPVTDPRTLLVVGTAGVHARPSRCQIAAYRVPPAGAVVVVVGWRTADGSASTGRAQLQKLVAVRRPSFECFGGRGAVADVVLGGRQYQVDVMVGDHASARRVGQALAVGRSFDLVR
jgi:hypothetical protein